MAGIRTKRDAHYDPFRFRGGRYDFNGGAVSEAQPQPKGAEVDGTHGLIGRGPLTVPEGVSLEGLASATRNGL